ncbi:hypothetical protein PybrP1_004235 [[Pythium] brassicae (nom. inval.)]|nr:hypothetical protein PybrP1_004235 [[Pythium] brassicae (nom. inval.)]
MMPNVRRLDLSRVPLHHFTLGDALRATVGKTRVAEALVAFLQAKDAALSVVHITEASVNVSRRNGYSDAREEKNTRSALKAAVELSVNAKTVVVLDALNYIKGSRYELFCKARTESTTYCVVYVDTPLALALERNAGRADGFEPHVIEELAARFEAPAEKNRWDSPLFRVTPESIAARGLPLEPIADAVYLGKAVKAGLATKAAPVVDMSFVQELDDVTGRIADALIAHQRAGGAADGLKAPRTRAATLLVQRHMPASEVRRHRRQFVKISQLRPCAVAAIGDLFVEYLNQQA